MFQFKASVADVLVEIDQGTLLGEQLQTVTKDGLYYSFKGIPYAAPPVGKLRFKAPEPPIPWEGIRNATEHGSICTQYDLVLEQYIEGSENCLFLNVYTPDLKPEIPMPVMFFIHGGGYTSGSGNSDFYGPDFLVSHGIVLVTINYRLEVLGFLSINTKEVPGNAGVKDQVAALRWVQRNIAKFGGDPDKVTVFGESTGASSTGFHIVSPMSKGLFKRAILMSGVPLADISISFEPRRRAFVLGKQLGMEADDPDKLLEFLQHVNALNLTNTNPFLTSFEELSANPLKQSYFVPVVEKDFGQERFLIEDPLESLSNGRVNDVDVMIGFTNEEALISLIRFDDDVLKKFDRYPEMFVPRKIITTSTPAVSLRVSDMIRNHYFGKKEINEMSIREFLNYLNEAIFRHDVHRFIGRLPENTNTNKYLYQFSCVSERNLFGQLGSKFGLSGAAHLDDLLYIFHVKLFPFRIDTTKKSYKMIEQTCTLFTNFAKYGNPTPDSSLGVVWPKYDNTNEGYLDIATNLTTGNHLDAASLDFWKTVYEHAGLVF
ncbi:unnamed protein product [Parnassius mnemosyne]|uniref:Carboxylic ester hydrolase n=1 Tax=Parnassius mnemosyne TaxID=213953 RepID=A0AAV1KV22_9NEOP